MGQFAVFLSGVKGSEPFFNLLVASLRSGTFVKCTLGKPLAGAPEGLRNVHLRPVDLRGLRQVSWTWRYQTRDEAKNLTPAATEAQLREMLGVQFANADLFTTGGNAVLRCNRRGEPGVALRRASHTETVDPRHNREKFRWIDPTSGWLADLGITGRAGAVLPAAQAKWRQINKFVEIAAGLTDHPDFPDRPRIADMGCGKGYLTFALHAFLASRGKHPETTGVESRAPLVETCRDAASRHDLHGLHFACGSIADFPAGHLDMLIALHACDTATDEALAHGVRCGARILVVAPCCHKQVRQQLHPQGELAPVLHHGILAERQSEILTDGIRALLLDAAGFDTRVFEFISTEHTAKNLMITAVRRSRPRPDRASRGLAQVAALKSAFGIHRHELEHLLFPAGPA